MKIQFKDGEIKELIETHIKLSGAGEILEEKTPHIQRMITLIEDAIEIILQNDKALKKIGLDIVSEALMAVNATIEEVEKDSKTKKETDEEVKAVITDSPMTFGAN